jgi:hypothetical protein
MPGRIPLIISGDLHAIAEGRMQRSGALDFSRKPIIVVLSGPLGTGDRGWPSAFRGIGATPPVHLQMEENLKPVEENGFIIRRACAATLIRARRPSDVDYFFRHYDSCCYMPERGRIHHAASNASPISPDHETSSDRRRAACDNRCRLCGLCALLRDWHEPEKARPHRQYRCAVCRTSSSWSQAALALSSGRPETGINERFGNNPVSWET